MVSYVILEMTMVNTKCTDIYNDLIVFSLPINIKYKLNYIYKKYSIDDSYVNIKLTNNIQCILS